MTAAEREPTRDELLAMAYVDGELADDARRELEARLPNEPALAREVAELRRLAVLARAVAPAEPMDAEWARIRADPAQRAGGTLGWTLLALGAAGLAGLALWRALSGPGDPLPRVLVAMAAGGLALLFLLVLRNRLRTLPYDPYRDVQR